MKHLLKLLFLLLIVYFSANISFSQRSSDVASPIPRFAPVISAIFLSAIIPPAFVNTARSNIMDNVRLIKHNLRDRMVRLF